MKILNILKNLVPSSLFGRFLLIILLPTIFAQLIATYMFYNRHWDSISRNMSYALYSDIIVADELIKQKLEKSLTERMLQDLNLSISTQPYNTINKLKEKFPPETRTLFYLLKNNFPYPINISFKDNNIIIKILKKNELIIFSTSRKRIDSSTTYIFIAWMTGTSLIFIFLSIIFTKNQIRPILRLARAADRFGRGQETLFLKPEGATEIRKATQEFIKMKERIEHQIKSRTEMLAGISHDLRTPLTRMKLQLTMSNDEDLKEMLQDIKEMEYMINSYLEFAKKDIREELQKINISKFIKKIISYYPSEKFVSVFAPNISIPIKMHSLKRCFQNLLDNSIKFGSKIIIEAYIKNNFFICEIHDNGPGIALENRENVFKPFYRIDNSRNLDKGGSGLGLAIARDIILNHGGNIELESSDKLGGLKIILSLPK